MLTVRQRPTTVQLHLRRCSTTVYITLKIPVDLSTLTRFNLNAWLFAALVFFLFIFAVGVTIWWFAPPPPPPTPWSATAFRVPRGCGWTCPGETERWAFSRYSNRLRFCILSVNSILTVVSLICVSSFYLCFITLLAAFDPSKSAHKSPDKESPVVDLVNANNTIIPGVFVQVPTQPRFVFVVSVANGWILAVIGKQRLPGFASFA